MGYTTEQFPSTSTSANYIMPQYLSTSKIAHMWAINTTTGEEIALNTVPAELNTTTGFYAQYFLTQDGKVMPLGTYNMKAEFENGDVRVLNYFNKRESDSRSLFFVVWRIALPVAGGIDIANRSAQ